MTAILVFEKKVIYNQIFPISYCVNKLRGIAHFSIAHFSIAQCIVVQTLKSSLGLVQVSLLSIIWANVSYESTHTKQLKK